MRSRTASLDSSDMPPRSRRWRRCAGSSRSCSPTSGTRGRVIRPCLPGDSKTIAVSVICRRFALPTTLTEWNEVKEGLDIQLRRLRKADLRSRRRRRVWCRSRAPLPAREYRCAGRRSSHKMVRRHTPRPRAIPAHWRSGARSATESRNNQEVTFLSLLSSSTV